MPARRPVRRRVEGPGGERDRGQVAIEFVGTVPLILLLVAAVWECVLIGYAFSLAGNAADEGARAGAVSGAAECRTAAGKYIGGAWNMGTPDCRADGNVYRATVTLRIPVLFPGLSFGSIEGTAGAAMEREE